MLTAVDPSRQSIPQQLPASDTSTGLSTDFQTFLRMLTAQAQYQDPLDPLDSAQYAAQLAQFSMVEQQTQTNALLSSLSDSGSGATALASWLGTEVRVDAPVLFAGQDVSLEADVNPNADAHVLIAFDPEGNEVARQLLDAFGGRAFWNASDAKGTALPHGEYSFEVAGYLHGSEISRKAAGTFHTVVEARHEDNVNKVVFSDGSTAPVSSVIAIREPGKPSE